MFLLRFFFHLICINFTCFVASTKPSSATWALPFHSLPASFLSCCTPHASTFCQQTNPFYVQITNWGNFIVGNVRFRLVLVIYEYSFDFFWMCDNVWERKKNGVKHISGHYSNTLLCWNWHSCSQHGAQHTECIQSVIALNNLPKAFMQHVSFL